MKINVTRSSMPPFEEYCNEIKELWDSHFLTNNGVKHNALQKQLNNFLDVSNTILFSNGHLALETALSLFHFPRGSEVITTPFTFVSTSNAIVRNDLIPVFCDINSETYTIDTAKIESLITKKTVAIVPVHVYGNVCNVEEISRIAKKHNLIVIYDAAHAFGVKYKNKGIASFGDLSMFSFHATKVFNTIEGGCLCFKNNSYSDSLNQLKNFGIINEEECLSFGGNAKMNEFQACMGICNLRHMGDEILKRKMIHDRYLENLSNVDGIKLLKSQDDVTPNYSYFPVVFDGYKMDRDEIKKKLAGSNIFARKYFYPIVSEFKCYSRFNRNNTPIAKYVSEHILTLPMYADLSLEEVDKICDIILS